MRKLLFLAITASLVASSSAMAAPYRADCRFHDESNPGSPKFCYASVEYDLTDGAISAVNYGVGCDNQTIYDDTGKYVTESTLDRIDPPTAATPALEIQPSGSLKIAGTYSSVLDGSGQGRISGTCYVHAYPVPSPSPSVRR